MNKSDSQLVTHLPRTSTFVKAKWLNKDRFWNLVFATLMTFGLFIAFTIEDLSKGFGMLSSIILLITLIGTMMWQH